MAIFRGTWPALVTPFTYDDTIHVSVLRDLVEYHLSKQVDGFYVCGRTGQGLSLSVPERQLVAETVLAQVQDRVPVVVHIGSMSVQDAFILARHAAQIGAAGISSIIPPYYSEMKPIVGYFQTVANVAPHLPFFPYLFGFPKVIELMQNLLPLPNVMGTKYTGPDMYEFQRVVNLRRENWYIFSGMDEQCLFARMSGATGSIGSTLNFMPRVYRHIHACFEQGKLAEAMEWQRKANIVTETLYHYNFMSGMFEVMRLLGFDCGALRLPDFPLAAEDREKLQGDLQAIAFDQLT
ncbi:MAG: dihydrodipicolinate synthase family protein [Candidatus Vecturithrix sp.]|jgi:N-acetylneuraminate lyase|nr:dihydrodipicolinate synthase family protein [Candidatus Vecturithrix sp.]